MINFDLVLLQFARSHYTWGSDLYIFFDRVVAHNIGINPDASGYPASTTERLYAEPEDA